MVTNQRAALLISFHVLILANLSRAWTSTAGNTSYHLSSSRGHNDELRKATTPARSPSSSGLNYNDGRHPEEKTYDSSTINDGLDTEIRLRVALQLARDADRLHGLCTPESARAWKIVDEIYSSSAESMRVEDNMKRVLGGEESVWGFFESERSYAA